MKKNQIKYLNNLIESFQVQATADTCPSNPISLSSYNITEPTSIYKMKFTTLNNQLPTLDTVTLSGKTFNSTITVTGTGFSATTCENKILIGGHKCPLTSSSTTQLVCIIGDDSGLLPNYPYQIEVNVKNIGFAVPSSVFTVQFSPVITSISPVIGSQAGGTQITIIGSGFIQKMTQIQIGNDIYSHGKGATVSYNSIVLTTNSQTSDSSNEVSVYSNNVKAVCVNTCNYQYDSTTSTPTVDSISPTSVTGSTLITLTGSNYGTVANDVQVNIGTQSCIVQSVTNTLLTCQLVGLNLDAQKLNVNVSNLGRAKIAQTVTIDGLASATAISPSTGSINGGTKLTISGNGFDSTTVVLIDQVKCNLVSFTVNTFVCLTGPHSAATGLSFQIT